MWDNPEWARGHLRKRHPDVTIEEAWEASFGCPSAVFLASPDQLNFPPFRRYWTIGHTTSKRELLVAWEQWREKKNLITAYPPSPEKKKIYERKTKKN